MISSLNPDRRWNVPKLRSFFYCKDVFVIRQILCYNEDYQDEILWHYITSGIFTISLAYQMAMDHKSLARKTVPPLRLSWQGVICGNNYGVCPPSMYQDDFLEMDKICTPHKQKDGLFRHYIIKDPKDLGMPVVWLCYEK